MLTILLLKIQLELSIPGVKIPTHFERFLLEGVIVISDGVACLSSSFVFDFPGSIRQGQENMKNIVMSSQSSIKSDQSILHVCACVFVCVCVHVSVDTL